MKPSERRENASQKKINDKPPSHFLPFPLFFDLDFDLVSLSAPPAPLLLPPMFKELIEAALFIIFLFSFSSSLINSSISLCLSFSCRFFFCPSVSHGLNLTSGGCFCDDDDGLALGVGDPDRS